jgi:hypothetical protein
MVQFGYGMHHAVLLQFSLCFQFRQAVQLIVNTDWTSLRIHRKDQVRRDDKSQN